MDRGIREGRQGGRFTHSWHLEDRFVRLNQVRA